MQTIIGKSYAEVFDADSLRQIQAWAFTAAQGIEAEYAIASTDDRKARLKADSEAFRILANSLSIFTA